jgi:hypothetical protein
VQEAKTARVMQFAAAPRAEKSVQSNIFKRQRQQW